MNYSLWKFHGQFYSRNYADNKCIFFFPSSQALWAKERFNCPSSENNWEEKSYWTAYGNSWSGTKWWTVHSGKKNVILWVCGDTHPRDFLLVEYLCSTIAQLSHCTVFSQSLMAFPPHETCLINTNVTFQWDLSKQRWMCLEIAELLVLRLVSVLQW